MNTDKRQSMLFWRKVLILLLSFLPSYSLADSIRISQIDSSHLLLNQQIRLYVSATDDEGVSIEGLSSQDFQILESGDGKNFSPIENIDRFQVGANYEEGIRFLLLLDNSGSMYRNIQGQSPADKNDQRISQAKEAIKSLLNSISNPKDQVGLVSYNSFYHQHSPLTTDIYRIIELLNFIEKPVGDASFTEIYGSLQLATEEFRTAQGRKAVIILSDGENSPYFSNTDKPHPLFGEKIIPYQRPIDFLQEEGISVYVIHFGQDAKDQNLNKIAVQTGGKTFQAENLEDLKSVYMAIVDQILNEYVLTYQATMTPTDKKHVQLRYEEGGKQHKVTRFYFSSTVFGFPNENFTSWFWIPFVLALCLLLILTKIRFEKQKDKPTLEILNRGHASFSHTVVPLGARETIIGCSSDADFTIAGIPEIQGHHATILFNEKKHEYRLQGKGELRVNNKIVQEKILEAGDVINIDGVTMVFDEGKK